MVDDDESANSSHLREQVHYMSKQSLPLKHWGLERWPVCGTADVGQFYPTAGHNEALARIEYLVDGRRRLGALLGDGGVGKSLVLRVAAAELAKKGRTAVLVDG